MGRRFARAPQQPISGCEGKGSVLPNGERVGGVLSTLRRFSASFRVDVAMLSIVQKEFAMNPDVLAELQGEVSKLRAEVTALRAAPADSPPGKRRDEGIAGGRLESLIGHQDDGEREPFGGSKDQLLHLPRCRVGIDPDLQRYSSVSSVLAAGLRARLSRWQRRTPGQCLPPAGWSR